jgi:GTP diphosphokinase / guanosine-3',5'-bis(diphosphate) 3'-diphosphatase
MEEINGIPIRGVKSDLPIRFAEGGAVPGERIVGILEPNEGLTIYPIHSPKLAAFDDQLDRWLDVTWDIEEGATERFPAQVIVTAINEPGTLAQIASVIGETDGNIDRLQMTGKASDYTVMLIDLEVWDLKHLNDIIGKVNGLRVVSSVRRVLG